MDLDEVSEAAFGRCLDWFIAHHEMFPPPTEAPGGLFFSLRRSHDIRGWKYGDDVDVEAIGGELLEAYGTLPYVGTRFTFRSFDEYRWVADVAATTLRIKMNDKHVRPRSAASGRT